MVLLKRTLEYGVNGNNLSVIPRAPRSTRKRRFHQKSLGGTKICAFELLATVAGKLLEERECSSASSSAGVRSDDKCGFDKDAIKQEPHDVDKPSGFDHDHDHDHDHDPDQGSSDSAFFLGIQKEMCKGKLETVNEMTGETWNSDELCVKGSCIVEGDSLKCGEFDDTNIDKNGGNSGDNTTIKKSIELVNSEENVELTLCWGTNPKNDVKRNCKDDDGILSQTNNTMKAFRSPINVADQKVLTSKYWKTAPKLKDYELSNSDNEAKDINPNKRSCYEIDRSQRNTPFKKRRLLDRSSVVTCDGGISCESVSNSPDKVINDDKNGSPQKMHEGKGTPSSVFCRQKSCNSRNSQVRLSIKSFKVPELFIEVPETTTVGSLKRTVLEAVTTILGGGLSVGVLLHGMKISDDNRTLLQSGISQTNDMDTVGFMLEPNNPTQPSPPICPQEPPTPIPCDSPKFVNRSQLKTNDDKFVVNKLEKPPTIDSNRPSETVKDFIPSLATKPTEKNVSNSKALVPIPDTSVRPLAVVPVNYRSKRADIGQRRTRRPFSVSEVEALVRAVEKLGTGRWRDVKLCAFENAKHRTYVDLKDKWKTLVHTARISPQQRRGEPVPQQLLDRVLAAQSYWSEHQTKQHGKHGIIPKLTNGEA